MKSTVCEPAAITAVGGTAATDGSLESRRKMFPPGGAVAEVITALAKLPPMTNARSVEMLKTVCSHRPAFGFGGAFVLPGPAMQANNVSAATRIVHMPIVGNNSTACPFVSGQGRLVNPLPQAGFRANFRLLSDPRFIILCKASLSQKHKRLLVVEVSESLPHFAILLGPGRVTGPARFYL